MHFNTLYHLLIGCKYFFCIKYVTFFFSDTDPLVSIQFNPEAALLLISFDFHLHGISFSIPSLCGSLTLK